MRLVEIKNTILESKYHPRSTMVQVVTKLTTTNIFDFCELMVDQAARSVNRTHSLTTACFTMGQTICNKLGVPENPVEATFLKVGIEAYHWLTTVGLTDVEKYLTIKPKRSKPLDTWYIVSQSKEFTDYCNQFVQEKHAYNPIKGPQEWVCEVMEIDGRHIPIVKRAEHYQRLHLYGQSDMPKVYDALNRLNAQTYTINQRILDLCSADFPFIPNKVSGAERKNALMQLNDVSRKAEWMEEIRFKEMHKWLLEEAEVEDETLAVAIAKKRAEEKSSDYYDEKSEQFADVISACSKREAFDIICEMSDRWKEYELNFTYHMDTRGRIYTIQNFLSPLGNDLAKSLLLFDEEQQVSSFDLCIHIANCFGKDKLSFEDRVKWVNANSYKLYDIGEDPIGNYHLIKELELDAEQKTRWQGIAACFIYRDYVDYVSITGDDDGFTTNLPVGLDATASGTQILTILGRDDKVAPFVNVSKSTTGKVGDFYTYLSDYLKPKLEEYRGDSPTLDAVLDNWKKYARKLAKRNSMTFVYSGTKWGFGQQQWQDRHSYGPLGSALTRHDCRIIGNEMYDVCVENIRGGAEIMKWLRDGVNSEHVGSIIQWRLPDGFLAFQVCDRPKCCSVHGVIGDTRVTLKYNRFGDVPDKTKHKNAIAPNFVHSLDAYLLRMIVNGLPEEAPVSTVHDQFLTSSYHIEDLQQVAKDAYKVIADRGEAERMAKEAFGIHRTLPKVGDWTINNIDEAEFIIC